MSKSLSGKEFKDNNKNVKFYKLLTEDETHYEYQFKKGLNIFDDSYENEIENQYNGFFFIDEDSVPLWINYKDYRYIREVEFLDNSIIYYIKEYKIFKADKFNLKERISIKDFKMWKDEYYCIRAIDKNPLSLKYTLQTYDLCYTAVNTSSKVLEFVDKNLQDYDLCLKAILNNNLLKYVREDIQNYELCLIAVKINNCNIEYVKKELQDYNLCLLAVKDCGENLKYVREDLQDYNLCLLASKSCKR